MGFCKGFDPRSDVVGDPEEGEDEPDPPFRAPVGSRGGVEAPVTPGRPEEGPRPLIVKPLADFALPAIPTAAGADARPGDGARRLLILEKAAEEKLAFE